MNNKNHWGSGGIALPPSLTQYLQLAHTYRYTSHSARTARSPPPPRLRVLISTILRLSESTGTFTQLVGGVRLKPQSLIRQICCTSSPCSRLARAVLPPSSRTRSLRCVASTRDYTSSVSSTCFSCSAVQDFLSERGVSSSSLPSPRSPLVRKGRKSSSSLEVQSLLRASILLRLSLSSRLALECSQSLPKPSHLRENCWNAVTAWERRVRLWWLQQAYSTRNPLRNRFFTVMKASTSSRCRMRVHADRMFSSTISSQNLAWLRLTSMDSSSEKSRNCLSSWKGLRVCLRSTARRAWQSAASGVSYVFLCKCINIVLQLFIVVDGEEGEEQLEAAQDQPQEGHRQAQDCLHPRRQKPAQRQRLHRHRHAGPAAPLRAQDRGREHDLRPAAQDPGRSCEEADGAAAGGGGGVPVAAGEAVGGGLRARGEGHQAQPDAVDGQPDQQEARGLPAAAQRGVILVGGVVERLQLVQRHLLPLRAIPLQRAEGGARAGDGRALGLEGDEGVLLDAVEPLALVDAAVLPVHLAVAVAVVVLEVAHVARPVLPEVAALAVLLVVHVLALVAVPVHHPPHAPPVTHPRQELAAVVRAVLPVVLAVALGAVRLVPPDVDVPVGEHLQPLLLLLPAPAHPAHEHVPRPAPAHAQPPLVHPQLRVRDLEPLPRQGRLGVAREEARCAALLPGRGAELAAGEAADQQGLCGLEDALAVAQPLAELAQVELLLVELEPPVLLVVAEGALEAPAREVVQDALLLAPLLHAPEEDAVLVLLEGEGAVHLLGLLGQQHPLVAAVVEHELLLRPLRARTLPPQVAQVHPPLQVALHLQLRALQRVEQRQPVRPLPQLLLHALEVLPEAVQALHQHRAVAVEVPHQVLEAALLARHPQRLAAQPATALAAPRPLPVPRAPRPPSPLLPDLHAAHLLVEQRLPLRSVVHETAVEQPAPLVHPALVRTRPDLGEARHALHRLLPLRRRLLRGGRRGLYSGRGRVEAGVDAGLLGEGLGEGGVGVVAVVGVEGVLAVGAGALERAGVAGHRHQQSYCYSRELFNQYQMGNATNLWLALLLLPLALAQNATTLPLQQHYPATLQPERTYYFAVELPQDIPSNSQFFLVVQWPSTDPLQNPFVEIFSEGGASWSCYNSDSEFSGVCSIPGQQLSPNSTLTAEVYCFTECALVLTPSLAPLLRLTLADAPTLAAPDDAPLPLQLEIQLPYDLNFTQLAVYAQIQSMEKASEGLEMLANVGNASREGPSKAQYDVGGESIFWGGKGIFLSKEMVRAGEWVRVYLQLSPGMQVRLFSSVISGNHFLLELGKSYFDFTSYAEDKLYRLPLANHSALIANRTISVGVVVYSGSPYIDIAMDSAFKVPFSERGAVANTNYQITAAMRAHDNFTGDIFIRVKSYWNADFLLYSQLQPDHYATLFPDIDLYNELQQGQVYNYFFDDLVRSGEDALRNYSLRVDVITGKIKFGIRRCRSAESSESILGCVIEDSSALKNSSVLSSFQEIELTIKQSDSYYYLVFQVDTSQCASANSSQAHYCSFHVAAIEDAGLTSQYTVSLNKRRYASTLKEGQLSRDMLFKNEYLFYRFILGSLQDVLSVTFYTTLIEGDLYLIGSTSDTYPTLDTEAKDLAFSVGNSLTFQKEQLANNIYITVYGIQLSEFTLGVKVIRNNNSTNSSQTGTEMAIKMDLSQEYTLHEADTSATFLIRNEQSLNVTVEVMMLAGTVTLEIKDSSNSLVHCSDEAVTNNKITCSFAAEGSAVYRATVAGKRGEVQKVVILYHKEDSCFPYSLNTPLYLSLKAGEEECVQYSLSKMAELEITSNVPLSHLVDQSLSMTVCLNGHCLPPAASHHHAITRNELIIFCRFGNVTRSNEVRSCVIKLLFASNSSLGFQVVAEEVGRDIGLFDGVVERVSSYDLSHAKGRYFYYEIEDWSAIKVFFTSLSSSAYYLALHFVEQADFLSNHSNIYLPYRDANQQARQDFEENFYESIVYSSYTSILTISSAVIDQYCSACVLAIAVYPWYEEAHTLASFEIEVSQTETVLFLGDSRIGYLESDEIYNYQVEPSADSDALVSIKDLSKESNAQDDCFAATLTSETSESPERVENGMAYIRKGSLLSNLYVEAMADFCNYEVTYTRLDFPLVVVSGGRKYPFERAAAGKMYLLYTHTANISFKIIQIINTGALTVYATPIANSTIAALLNAQPASFPFVDSDSNGEFIVRKDSPAFCWNCQYLIAVACGEAVSAEIIVANENSSVPLSVNGIIKEKLSVGESAVRNYTFNSISAFNITFSPIYGRLSVVVIDPQKKVVVNSTLTSSQNFLIPHNNDTEYFAYDYNSYFTRYAINVAALADSSYTIKVSKESITSRIFEGIPFYYDFEGNETIKLEFLNLNSPNPSSNSLNILVDLIDYQNAPRMDVAAVFESREGAAPEPLPVTSLRLSDNVVYNIELPLKKGTYYISLTVDQPVSTSITLAKQSLIHLAPSSSAILFKEGLFELYSASKAAMIEVFTCYGDLRISASSNYNDLSGSKANLNELVLEQSNYGGHFVINAEEIYGEYFIKVMSRKSVEQGYLITYHYYDRTDTPPYKLIELAEREITYAFTSSAILFRFNPIAVRWDLTDAIQSVLVEYRVFVADSKAKVGQYANCRLGSIYQVSALLANIHPEYVEIPIELGEISKIVGEEQIYFVGAEALVSLELSESASAEYPTELKLIYDTIELSNIKSVANNVQPTTSYSPQVIVLWFLLPFAIAGAILYFALKYCIRKYRGLLPNELMEEGENGESEQAVQSRSPFDNKAAVSQELKDEV